MCNARRDRRLYAPPRRGTAAAIDLAVSAVILLLATPAWAEQERESSVKFSASQCRVMRQMGIDTRLHCREKTFLFTTTVNVEQQPASIVAQEATDDANVSVDSGDRGGAVPDSGTADRPSGGGSPGSPGGGGGSGGSKPDGGLGSGGAGRPGGPDLIPEPPPPKPPPVTAITPPGKPIWEWFKPPKPPDTSPRPGKLPDFGKPGVPDFGKPGSPGADGDHRILRSIIRDRLRDRIRDRLGGGAQPRGNSRWGGSHR